MLTDFKIRNAKPRDRLYRVADARGLCLEIHPNGARYWRFRYRWAGKGKMLSLGVYPETSLAEARQQHEVVRASLRNGVDPSLSRQQEKLQARLSAENTFEAIAHEWIEAKRLSWSVGHTNRTLTSLIRDAFPLLGACPIGEITTPEVLHVLREVEKRGALDIAKRLAQRISCVFRHAVFTQRAAVNPAADLGSVIKTRKVEHRAALSANQLPEFFQNLQRYDGRPETRLAIWLLMLTFVRTGELRGARWEEIELEKAEWRIPAARMKMGREHIVPLASQTLAALKELHTITGWSPLLFPGIGESRKPISENTVLYALYRMGYHKRATAHGFRALASTCLNESGWPPHVIEAQLAHEKRDKIAAAYNRAHYLPERRKMMQSWSDYLDSLRTGATVIPLHSRAA